MSRSVLRYHVVDVFTDVAFAGNPLAVVLGAEDLSTMQMQRLAREFHLSETAFPLLHDAQAATAAADYRLRIFTPEVELPFAGHPSIGSAWLLHDLGLVQPRGQRLVQLCGAGVLELLVGPRRVTLTGAPGQVGPRLDPAPALAAVGLTEADLLDVQRYPPSISSAGLAYAVVPVTPAALAACQPNSPALRQAFSYPSDATGVYVVTWDGAARPLQVHARMFAGDVGVDEDAATGSAALALGWYLTDLGVVGAGEHVTVHQGEDMGRPSLLEVSVARSVARSEGEGLVVRVAGSVVPVASGEVVVPAPD